jgi:hypothetical protein
MGNNDEATTPPSEEQEQTDGESDADESDATDGGGLTKNEIFTILKNPRRRETLEYLERNDGEADLSDLAESLAARENDIEVEALSSTQRKRVYISLYQVHLPKMDDLGVLEFDKHRGTIELTDAGAILFPYLHFDPHADEQPAEEADSTPLRSVRDRLSDFIGSDES